MHFGTYSKSTGCWEIVHLAGWNGRDRGRKRNEKQADTREKCRYMHNTHLCSMDTCIKMQLRCCVYMVNGITKQGPLIYNIEIFVL